ncbi:cell division protein FtsL [Candidatus Blochmannia vicinus]|uniref:Cell division protein FtsL n=1 Tax=Candidatus Blochmannia vicinus (nom. nud.) TaxID=251540 RepID=A0ABY4SUB4_9ENTR|nr:cell division protein FtsL [Candidatus Blochmannia vicinus]URJ32828.1 cell division protein FtsL [Candidatus Blochmannia vicinus]
MKKKQYNLISIIYDDLFFHGKQQLLLLLLVLTSAMLVILVTYHTRSMIMDREKLLLEKDALDTEWRNLILEEKILSDHSRIEGIAINKLQMHYVDPTQNNIFH